MSITLDPTQREYLNPNLWEIIFTDVSLPVNIPLLSNELSIKFLVSSTTLPFEKFGKEMRKTGTKHITSVEFVDEFSITFNETEDLEVYTFLKQWKDTIYDETFKTFKHGAKHTKNAIFNIQKYSLLSDLRATGALPSGAVNSFFASDLKYRTIKTFEFKNILLLGIEDLAWDYQGTGNKQITANFSVDEVIEKFSLPA